MTAPAIDLEQDVLDRARALRAAGVPLAEIEKYIQSKASPTGGAAVGGLQREYQAGTLGGRMARENANDADAAALEADGPSAARQALAATGVQIASGVPGMEAVMAAIHARTSGQSYQDARADLHALTSKLPNGLAVAERAIGAAPVLTMLPGGATTKGALYGALSGLAGDDPDASRADDTFANAVVGGALGWAGGKIAPKLSSIVRGTTQRELFKSNGVVDAVRQRMASAADASRRVASSLRAKPSTAQPPSASAAGSSMPGQLTSLLDRARAAQPGEIGNQIGDAELAMRGTEQPDLEDLLRRSIVARGGTPRP